MEPTFNANTFAALCETIQDLAEWRDLHALLNAVVERAAHLLGTREGYIYLYDREQKDLELVAAKGLHIPLGTRLHLGEGMAGSVAQLQKSMSTEDYRTWEGRSPQFEGHSHTSVLGVPMLYAGDLVGVLLVSESVPTKREFSEEAERTLSLLASLAASAVHSSHLTYKEKQRASQLTSMYDAGLALNSVQEPRNQLEHLFGVVMEALNADRVEYLRFDPANNEVTCDLSLGAHTDPTMGLNNISIPVGDKRWLIGWVIRKQLPLNISNLGADPRNIFIESELRSGLFVPVIRDSKVLGVLCVFSKRENAYYPEHERLLFHYANQTAIVLENARLLEETQRRMRLMQAQRKIDKAIARTSGFHNVLKVFLEQATSQLCIDAATVLLLNKHTQNLEYAAGHGFYTSTLQETNLTLGDTNAGRAAQERQLITISDLREVETGPLLSTDFRAEGFIAYYAVPLIAKGIVNGVLELFHRTPHTPDHEWNDLLEALADQAAIAIDSVNLFNGLQKAHFELTLAYDATLEGWVRALDLRDKETEGHTIRVSKMSILLAQAMGVEDDELLHIRRGALLHDIGKIGVPDNILNKPGSLSDQEWEIMHKHPFLAYDLLSPIDYLHKALEIPFCHHEKWDGSGYPRGLKGEQIPLSARIFTVVDVWDALCSNRPYRKAWSQEAARAYIEKQAGKHFDPIVVDVFLRLIDKDPKFEEAAKKFDELTRVKSELASLD